MALTRTGTAVRALKTLIVSNSFTNVNVVEAVIPTSSRNVQEFMKQIVTGNSTIAVMPRTHNVGAVAETTRNRVQKYTAPLRFTVAVYSKFYMTDKAEDVVKLYDGLVDLLHNNGYKWLTGGISDAVYDFNNQHYYEAKIDVEYYEIYPKN